MRKTAMKMLVLTTVVFSGLFAGTDGTIRGRVTDINSVGLPGASVYLPDVGLGAAADVDGNYIILNIPVGSHDVVVQMVGYKKITFKEVTVMMDQTVWLDPVMETETVKGDEVVVHGQRPLVERGTTAKKITVDKEAIQSLPLRDMSELYTLQSGVV